TKHEVASKRAVSALISVYEMEDRRRKVFLMERYLSTTSLFIGQEVWNMTTSEVIARTVIAFRAVDEDASKIESLKSLPTPAGSIQRLNRIPTRIAYVMGKDEHRDRYPEEFKQIYNDYDVWDAFKFTQEIRLVFSITMINVLSPGGCFCNTVWRCGLANCKDETGNVNCYHRIPILSHAEGLGNLPTSVLAGVIIGIVSVFSIEESKTRFFVLWEVITKLGSLPAFELDNVEVDVTTLECRDEQNDHKSVNNT
ncbi:hypothetical protein HDU76_002981, partial [Blyttiomyces sp. JEL0837]